jgi:hypothetical protein
MKKGQKSHIKTLFQQIYVEQHGYDSTHANDLAEPDGITLAQAKKELLFMVMEKSEFEQVFGQTQKQQ